MANGVVSGLNSTGIQEVSKGDIVFGYYFTTLTDKLNEWIGGL